MRKDVTGLRKFMRNWKKLSVIEDRELRAASVKQRLDQLASLVCLGLGLGLNFEEDKQVEQVRARWVALKRNVK